MRKSIVFLLIFIMLMSTVTFAVSNVEPDGDIMGAGKTWINLGKDQNVAQSVKWTGLNDLAGMLFGIGVFVAAISGIILGIKYMFASAEEKSDIKESLYPYIIGTVIILGALGIWKFLVEFLDGIV